MIVLITSDLKDVRQLRDRGDGRALRVDPLWFLQWPPHQVAHQIRGDKVEHDRADHFRSEGCAAAARPWRWQGSAGRSVVVPAVAPAPGSSPDTRRQS